MPKGTDTCSIRRRAPSSWSAPSGETREKASSSTCSPSAPTGWCATRAARTPDTRCTLATPSSCVLHQIPSGILHPGVRCAIGNGVVLDPDTLFTEIDELVARWHRRRGTAVRQRSRASRAAVPQAASTARARRARRSAPRAAASGPRTKTRSRVAAFACSTCGIPTALRQLVERGVEHANAQLARFDSIGAPTSTATLTLLERLAPRLLRLAEDVGLAMHQAIAVGRGGAARGRAGLAARRRSRHVSVRDVEQHDRRVARRRRRALRPTAIDAALGVVKAYTTRVGNGPLPTEFDEQLGDARAQAGQRVRRDDGSAAALRLVRRGRRSLCRARQRPDRARGHEARRARHARPHRALHRLSRGR